MKCKEWTTVTPTEDTGERLPAGGYVVRITKVEDVPEKNYLWCEFDIAEGEHTGHFSDEYSREHPYLHRFSRSYTDKAEGFFAAFLQALEQSNRGKFIVLNWQATCDPQKFVGLEIGIVVQVEKYTNDHGEDKERNEVVSVLASQDIRNGDYKLPPVKDSRKILDAPLPVQTQDEELPFS